ncbi:MAG: hypothetical protein HC779_00285 [Phyllobacteriaceae bacterium]|nr:hypothetical protein [Phyllobacteriaceae bacterium]
MVWRQCGCSVGTGHTEPPLIAGTESTAIDDAMGALKNTFPAGSGNHQLLSPAHAQLAAMLEMLVTQINSHMAVNVRTELA